MIRKTGIDYKGSSEHLRKKFNIKKSVDFRLRVFGILLVLMAAGLIVRLYTIQISSKDYYDDMLAQFETAPLTLPTMRGEFFDRNGTILVSNRAVNTITYFPTQSITDSQEWDLAYKIAENFTVEDTLVELDLNTLWIQLNDNGNALVSDDEALLLDATALFNLKVSRITQDMRDSIPTIDRLAFKVYYSMNEYGLGQAAVVIDNASNEEISYLSENIYLYPGFTFQTGWEREYNETVNVRGIIGSVSSIPYEKLDYFNALGYANNDKVGSFGLEYYYEELLSGVKSTYRRVGDNSTLELISEGLKGYDLYLTIDVELQQEVEAILTQALIDAESEPRRTTLSELHMVVSDPQTGDILALAAIKRASDGTYYNDPQAVLLSAFPVGSAIKGATVYMGLDQGVVQPGELILDTPMVISGTPTRSSWRNLGYVSDLMALQLSSNIYMFNIAIRLGGSTYIPNGSLVFNDAQSTYNLMRSYYSQFGLGVKTQIDYPREELGFKGSTSNSGNLLDFAIGQFDNYNALQLNQYVSTIANGGYRLQPRLVLDARDADTGRVVYENAVTVLNTLDNVAALNRVREGFRLCVATSNCGNLVSAPFTAAGKTGTAQDYNSEYGENVLNNSFVSFAPFDDPQIATSCIAPSAYIEGSTSLVNICTGITAKVVESYMNSD